MGLAQTFKALSEPLRRDILLYIKEEKKTAGEIAAYLKLSPAALSYHLTLLKKADLIFESKYKNFIYYELNVSVFDAMILWMKQFNGGNDNETSDET